MKTRITEMAVKAAMVAGLAAGLAFGSGLGTASADHTDGTNYFDRHPGPVNGRTGIDPHDPYAPVDLGGASGALRLGGIGGVGAGTAAEDPCSPQRCRAW